MYMTRRSKFTISFDKKYGYIENRDLKNLQKAFRVKSKDINTVYDRGIGAYYNNPSSVRSSVDNSVQWAMARVYKFLLNVVKYRKGDFDKIPRSAGSDYKYVKSSGGYNNYIPEETK